MNPLIIATLCLFLLMIFRRIAWYLTVSPKEKTPIDDAAVQKLVQELECDLLTPQEREKLLQD